LEDATCEFHKNFKSMHLLTALHFREWKGGRERKREKERSTVL
jgi:hypothetical protein